MFSEMRLELLQVDWGDFCFPGKAFKLNSCVQRFINFTAKRITFDIDTSYKDDKLNQCPKYSQSPTSEFLPIF